MAIDFVTAGESHGKMSVGIISNIPSGLFIDSGFIANELKRRRMGFGRSARMQVEDDVFEIVSGVRGGISIGSPIALLLFNRDHSDDRSGGAPLKSVTAVRPGHADLSGAVKYGFNDARNVLERASARSTAITVALGAIAKQYLGMLGISIGSHITAIGNVKAQSAVDLTDINGRADNSEVRCLDKAASDKMIAAVQAAADKGDTLGGVAQIVVNGVKSGVGSYVSADKRLDGMIMRAVGAVPSVKAVEIGDGIIGAALCGSEFHDEIFVSDNGKYERHTNRAGGIEGGMSNGEPIIVNAYFKPIPTLKNGLNTVDISTGKAAKAAVERADVCAAPSGGVVAESAVALALCTAVSDMFGGDRIDEVVERYGKKESAV